MGEGRIYYAEQDGNYYLKFVGDVRVTLCTTINTYVERIFAAEDMTSVVIDLSSASGVDSTTLGLLAKIAIYAENDKRIKPLLISADDSMVRLLEGMGFDEIFCISPDFPASEPELKQLECCAATSEEARLQAVSYTHLTLPTTSRV